MATRTEGGNGLVDALFGWDDSPDMDRYIRDRFDRAYERLNKSSRHIVEQGIAYYNEFMDSDLVRRSRALRRRMASQWDSDVIRPLRTVAECQNAPYRMRPYLMAEPSVRRLYHKQQCEGYGETYTDIEPTKVGEDHYHYRRVMDGIVEIEEDGWSMTQYLDDLYEDESPLTDEEQIDIYAVSWVTLANAILDKEDDPTSEWNASL